MVSPIPESILKWFQAYVQKYRETVTQFKPLISQRIEHSYCVAEYCGNLADDLRWTGDEKHIGVLLGLLHDIGRFDQIAQYGTIIDSDSINHGEHGYETARKEPVILSLPARCLHIVLNGIRYHNRRKFHDDVTPDVTPFIELVRDAEKLDRYSILSPSITNLSMHKNTAPFQEDSPAINPFIINEIQKERAVSRKHIRSHIDMHLVELSWIYDIYYQPTFRRIRENGIIDKIIAFLPQDDNNIRLIIESVRNHMKNHTMSS